MKKLALILWPLLLVGLIALLWGEKTMHSTTNIYGIPVTNIMGLPGDLSEYQGKVLMIVNTASKCGFTKQYADLQKLWETYEKDGLVILGFPANNFMGQEPGTDAEIQNFCQINYGVSFPMYSKISVKGKDIHPLFAYLTDKKAGHEHGGAISWNFTKFLISRDGRVIDRFSPNTSPSSENVIAAIEAALKQ